MGLILTILTFIAAALVQIPSKIPTLNLAHKLNLALLMLLSAAVVITAFIDISSISICATQFLPQAIFVVLGFLFAIPYLTVLNAVLAEMGLRKWFLGRMVEYGIEKEKGLGVDEFRDGMEGGHRSISKPFDGGRV
jgi:hypothetical protein